jgi:hypothetical protein
MFRSVYLCRLCSCQAMIFIATANRHRNVNVTNNVYITGLMLLPPSCDAVEPMRSDVQGQVEMKPITNTHMLTPVSEANCPKISAPALMLARSTNPFAYILLSSAVMVRVHYLFHLQHEIPT